MFMYKHEYTLTQTHVLVHTCMDFQINGIISNRHIRLVNHRQDIFQRNTSSYPALFTILELIIHSYTLLGIPFVCLFGFMQLEEKLCRPFCSVLYHHTEFSFDIQEIKEDLLRYLEIL